MKRLGGSTGAWQSLSVTIVSGLVFATAISLLAIPVLIHITDDLRGPGITPYEEADAGPIPIILKPTTPRSSAESGSKGRST
jgi:predicted RND superfamily exporter protein